MTTVYVREQGAVVHRKGARLVVTKNAMPLMDLPLLHVEQLAIVGNVQLTTQAVAALLQQEVDVVFFSTAYRYRGRLMATGSKFAELRHAQLRAMLDEPTALRLAKGVVEGKLANQQALLARRQADADGAGAALGAAAAGIGAMRAGAGRAADLDSLRGYEGKAGAHYFGALKALLDPSWGFRGREYYPPPDPVNAVLSFGYTLLLKDAVAATQLVGLDPYLGFFHAIHYGRPSLALDVLEEFRPLVVDRLVLRLIRDGHVSPSDFVRTGQPRRPVMLSAGASETFLLAYETEMGRKAFHPGSGRSHPMRRCVELQARQVAAIVLGKADGFTPMTRRAAVGP